MDKQDSCWSYVYKLVSGVHYFGIVLGNLRQRSFRHDLLLVLLVIGEFVMYEKS